MLKVAVVGAAGYVGRVLCVQLARDGTDVTGIARASNGFLLDRGAIRWVAIENAPASPAFDVVVNLAYPTVGTVYDYPRQNSALAELIASLAAPDGLVIQVSTQAVFGMALEYPQTRGRVRARRDFLYVEAKLELENLLLDRLAGPRLHIVRLGNIWGPGSAAWTGELARRLTFGEPVKVRGRDGMSNVTDIANLVSYLSFLARAGAGEERVQFHHLAELGGVPWSYWIEEMSTHLGVAPIAERSPAYTLSKSQELRAALVARPPRAVARELKDGRFTGSVVRSAMRVVPARARDVLRGRWASGGGFATPGADEDLFLTVLGCPTRLLPLVDTRWVPPVDERQSWLSVAAWLDEVGFA